MNMRDQLKDSTLRWGVVSTGNISNDFTTCLRYLGCQLKAVAARKKESAETFASKYGFEKSYGSYTELFNDPEIDVVYIGAVHPQHRPLAVQALEAGKHVVCEKPLGINVREAKEIVEAAQRSGKFLLEGFWTRFFPLMKRVKELCLKENYIGDVKRVTADFGLCFPREAARIWDRDEMCGGALMDVGCYPVTYVPWLLGEEFSEIKATGVLDEASGVDVLGTVICKTPSNKVADVSWGGISPTPEEIVISGTNGYIKICPPAHTPLKVCICKSNGRGFDEEVLNADLPVFSETETFIFPNSQGFVFEIVAVDKAIKEGKVECEEMTWKQSIATAELLTEARKQIGLVYPQDKL